MTVTFFPFNSIVVNGVPDRPANAENLAAYLAGFFSNGVLMQEDTALKVEAYSGMKVQIHAGMGNINGKTILADATEIITLDTASASQNRIDRVVFRLDEANRLMEFDVLKGTPAANPVAPALTQNTDVYELCLAEIRVPAGATSIAASYITDTRADAEICGASQIPAHMQDIEHGGTGATTAADARTKLGLGNVATENILPIAKGGTGATTAADARQAINVIGLNPITSPSNDTPANWVALGTGIAYYNKASCLNDQPTTNGFIVNRVYGSTVHQTFYLRGAAGTSWVRAGNASGWGSSWVEMLNESSGTQTVKVWTNASPTSAFAAQTVSMDLSDGDFVDIEFGVSGSGEKFIQRYPIGVVGITQISTIYDGANDYTAFVERKFTINTSNIVFQDASFRFASGSASNTVYNGGLIPQAIYLVKGVQ